MGERGGGGKVGVEGGETVIGMYYMREDSIFNKNETLVCTIKYV